MNFPAFQRSVIACVLLVMLVTIVILGLVTKPFMEKVLSPYQESMSEQLKEQRNRSRSPRNSRVMRQLHEERYHRSSSELVPLRLDASSANGNIVREE